MMAGGIRFGQWPRVGLVLARAIAVERQFVEKLRGRRCRGPFVVPRIKSGAGLKGRVLSSCVIAGAFLPEDRPRSSRPSRRSPGRRRIGVAPFGPQQRGGWRTPSILLRAAKPGLPRRRKMVGGRHCEPEPAPADRRSGRPERGSLTRRLGHRPSPPAAAAPHSGMKPGGNSRSRRRTSTSAKRLRSAGTS
jgi:hypothetical protein